MTTLFGLDPIVFAACCAVALFAGFVKGTVGFALPMIMISGLSAFVPLEIALAGLLFSTLLSNLAQALRQGLVQALRSSLRYWRLISCLIVSVLLCAPLINVLPPRLLYLILGVPILLFAAAQLMGRELVLPARRRARAEVVTGLVTGFFGGLSSIWAPTVIAYLMSFNTEKTEMIRVMGVVFSLGTVTLTLAHAGTGVLNPETAPFSAVLVIPVMLGMWAGLRLQDSLSPDRFRKITLVMLALAALNLLRRAAMG